MLALTLLLQAAPGLMTGAAQTSSPRVLAEFAMEPQSDLILLPVRVGGKELNFLLDTGTTVSIFDSSLSSGAPVAQALIKPPSGASVERDLYAAPEASVGGLDMRPAGPVLYHDFSMLRAVADRDISGLIGMAFLKDRVVQIDLDQGKVRFLDPAAAPASDWGVGVPMRLNRRGIPVVAADVGELGPVDFELDTGDNGGGNLVRDLFERLFPRKRGARGKSLLFTGVTSSPLGRAPKVSIGKLTLRGIVLGRAGISSLGMDFVRRSVITLDFPRQTMHIKPGARFKVPDETDMSGLHLLRREGLITALAVDAGSPADQAGMLAGDVIAAVPGQPEAERDLVALRRLLRSGAGRRVALSVLREGRAIPVELRLHKAL
jgi:hypothetical protein